MKTIKNQFVTQIISVDLSRRKFTTCYRCGSVMPENECTVYMHEGCWHQCPEPIKSAARYDLGYAILHNLTAIPKGIGLPCYMTIL